MEINEATILDDRGFVKINGDEAKSFLQNIVTNDIEKITDSLTLFSSIFTPQGKYLYEFFILKFEDGYLLECEKKLTSEIIKIFDFYKLRAKVNLIDVSKKYTNIIISLEKFKEIDLSIEKQINNFNRQALHAKSLGFVHPKTKKEIFFEASRPKDFDTLIKNLNKASL